jgi:hypothetical protein
METQPTNQQALTPQEASALIDTERAQAAKERAANGKFVKLSDQEQREIVLTGNMLTEAKEWEVGKGQKTQIVFELVETNSNGEHRTFSCSPRAQVAKDLRDAILAKKFRINLKRNGLGRKTTYFTVATTV